MKTVLFKNADIIDDTEHGHSFIGDLLIKNGRIEKMAYSINEEAECVIDASGNYLCPGFIDSHVHAYPVTPYGMNPDKLGVERWNSTIIDAGTSGSENFIDFKNNYIDKSKTKIFVLLNLCKTGLLNTSELSDPLNYDADGIRKLVKEYPEIIVGLKARASSSVVGKQGIRPIRITAELAHELNLPIMVHVGHCPPAIEEVFDCLEKGDIITHAFNGKGNGIIKNDAIIPPVVDAVKRGVKLDIGHGTESFSFDTYRKAKKLGYDCNSISSDLWKSNYEGPVFSLLECVNKLINCGEPLFSAIDKVTRIPADYFSLKKTGALQEGFIGDVFMFKFTDCNRTVQDSEHKELVLRKEIKPICLIISRRNESERINNSN